MYHFIIDDHKIEQKGCRVASQFGKPKNRELWGQSLDTIKKKSWNLIFKKADF